MGESLTNMPDIFDWEKLEPGEARNAYMDQFKDLSINVYSHQQHIPERFLKGKLSLK